MDAGRRAPWLATGSSDGNVILWDAAFGRKQYSLTVPRRTEEDDKEIEDEDEEEAEKRKQRARRMVGISCVRWSLDGTQLVTGHQDGSMRIVALDGEVVHR